MVHNINPRVVHQSHTEIVRNSRLRALTIDAVRVQYIVPDNVWRSQILISSWSCAHARCVIRPDQPRLVLPRSILRLAERETTVPPHTLHRAYLLDGFLEPSNEPVSTWLTVTERKRTVLDVAGNLVCYTFESLVLCGTSRACKCADSWNGE